ncbi:MAG: carbohydrate-binding protein [Lachnospiraceae bacterium]|nr:carbohydrate-binding protein [Lachnospiraceae bacterium]
MNIQIENKKGSVLDSAKGQESCSLIYREAYREGDRIVIQTDHYPCALEIKVDDTMDAGRVWLTGTELIYIIPFGEAHDAYAPEAFQGTRHIIEVHEIPEEDWKTYGNLSVNPIDQRGETNYYPHCTASVETRGESVFAARNTIDGLYENTCHGEWPYTSWGDNEDPRASITIEFGEKVLTDKIAIQLRADFPHDNYWHSIKLLFSDGTFQILSMEKTADVQYFTYENRMTSSVTLCELQKDENDPSPFPALTQWAVYGCPV